MNPVRLQLAFCLLLLGCDETQEKTAVPARLQTAWSGYARCMAGSGLKPGEAPSKRLRALWLMRTSANAPKDLADWPERCAHYRGDLAAVLADTEFSERLGRLLSKDRSPDGDLAILDAIWEAAQEAGLKEGKVEAPRLPEAQLPIPAKQLVAARLGPSGDILDSRLERSGPLAFTLRGGRPDRWSFCQFAAGLAQAQCFEKLPRDGHLEPLDAAPGAPALLRRSRTAAESDMLDAKSGKSVGPYVSRGFSRKDGSYIGIEPAAVGHGELIVVRGGEVRSRSKLRRDTRVVAGFYVEKRERKQQDVLEISPLEADEPAEPKLAISGSRVGLVCAMKQVTAVTAEGASSTRIAFLRDGKWSDALSVPVNSAAFPRWRCGAGKVSATWYDVDHGQRPATTRVHRVVCDESSCSATDHAGPRFAAGGTLSNATLDLGGALAVVWGADSEPLRLTVAPLDKLDATVEVVAVDTPSHGGIEYLPSTIELFERGSTGLLVFSDHNFSYALHFNASGKIGPVEIKRP